MKNLLLYTSLSSISFALAGCASLPEDQAERDIYPSWQEVVTLGLVTDAHTEEEELEKEEYQRTFVQGDKDERTLVSKSLHKVTMGLFFRPETKTEYEERTQKEERNKQRYVSKDLDERNVVDKTIYWMTDHESVAPETWEERRLRLKEKAEKQKIVKYDMRTESEKRIDLVTMGVWQPGKPEPYVPENAVGTENWLDAIVYGISTYEDVVTILGKPIKQVKTVEGVRTSTFITQQETFKRVPFVGSPRETVKLTFDKDGLLMFPEEVISE